MWIWIWIQVQIKNRFSIQLLYLSSVREGPSRHIRFRSVGLFCILGTWPINFDLRMRFRCHLKRSRASDTIFLSLPSHTSWPPVSTQFKYTSMHNVCVRDKWIEIYNMSPVHIPILEPMCFCPVVGSEFIFGWELEGKEGKCSYSHWYVSHNGKFWCRLWVLALCLVPHGGHCLPLLLDTL